MRLCKWSGLFAISRMLTRDGLRILCYHGFGTGEEVTFRPGLFIRPETFRRRLQHLKSAGYPVLSLPAALTALANGSLRTGTSVITVDDLFYGFYVYAAPLLEEFDMPATGYLTTYYCLHQRPVFRLLVRFMFWKTTIRDIDFRRIDPRLPNADMNTARGRAEAEEDVVAFGEALDSETDRTALADRLAQLLEVDCSAIISSRALAIVSEDEARELTRRGIDLQLHTHRHRLPEDETQVVREITDNRRVLRTIAHNTLEHFCYPSGIWSHYHWPLLRSLGVVSATTCDSGLNYSGTPPLALKRILDAEDVSEISFEAEVSGFKPLIRNLLRVIGLRRAEKEEAWPQPLT